MALMSPWWPNTKHNSRENVKRPIARGWAAAVDSRLPIKLPMLFNPCLAGADGRTRKPTACRPGETDAKGFQSREANALQHVASPWTRHAAALPVGLPVAFAGADLPSLRQQPLVLQGAPWPRRFSSMLMNKQSPG